MALQMSDLLARIQQTYESQKSSFPAYRWVSERDYQVHNFMCEVKKERIPQHWNRHDTAAAPAKVTYTRETRAAQLKQQPEVQHSKNMKLKRFFSIEFKQLHLSSLCFHPSTGSCSLFFCVMIFFFLFPLKTHASQSAAASSERQEEVKKCWKLFSIARALLCSAYSFIHSSNENCSLSNRAEFSNSRKKKKKNPPS